MKKNISILFIAFFAFIFNIIKVQAVECVEFLNGSGTVNDPYQITTNQELYSISCNMNSAFILKNDLDLTDDTTNENGLFYNNGKGWLSLGNSSTEFTGTFNGNNKKIVGIHQNVNNETSNSTNSTSVGLFTNLAGNIFDLTLENYYINYTNKNEIVNNSYNNFYVSTLSTYVHNANISNVNVSGKIEISNTNEKTNNLLIGGIFGRVTDSNLNGIISNIDIKTGNSLLHGTGGIVSELENSILKNSINYGNIEGNTVGGICQYNNNSTIDNVKNYGTITATNAGGLAFQTGGRISNSANYGTINMISPGLNGVSVAGGIAGWLNSTSSDITTSYIINSYNAGTINATLKPKDGDIGGLVGSAGGNMDDGTKPVYIENSFNIGEINVTNASNYSCIGGLVGRSNAHIKNSYNAGNINLINSNNAYHVAELVGAIVRMSSDNSAGSLENVYYIEKGILSLSNDGGSKDLDYKSLSFNQAISQTSYKNFDFTNVWKIDNNYPFPQLITNSVNENYISQIKIDNDDYDLISESEYQINYSILPSNIDNNDVEFKIIEGKDIATINNNGQLNLIGEGKLIVRVFSKKLNSIYAEKEFMLKLRKDINTLKYQDITNPVYNGSAFTPEINIYDDEYKLIKNEDYTISYSNNINAGTATIKIVGINDFKGEKIINFEIKKADISYTSSDNTVVYNGKENGINLKVNTPNVIVKYADNNGKYNLTTMPKYINAGTYKIKYQLSLNDNYNIKTDSNTLIINKGNYVDSTVDKEVIYDSKEYGIDLKITPNDYNVNYSVGSNNKYELTEMPKFSKPGEYFINYKLFSNNYNNYVAQKKLTIYGIVNFDSSLKLSNNIFAIRNYNNNYSSFKNNIQVLAKKIFWKHLDSSKNISNTETIKTGDYVQIVINDSKTFEYQLSVLGDVNGDGKISALDYVKIKNHIMKTSIISENVNLISADLNEDNKISALDYVRIKNYIMNGGK